MADAANIWSRAELISARGLRAVGSLHTPVQLSLSGGEVVDIIGDVAAGATEVLWNSASSVVASIEIACFVSDTNAVYFKVTGATAADYSFVAAKAGLWHVIGGKVLSYAAAAEQNITKIEAINKSVGVANVRLLAE